MTETTAHPDAAATLPAPPEQRQAPEQDPGDRGQLTTARGVLRKIVEYAADQACGQVRPPGRTGVLRWHHRTPRAKLYGPDHALRIRLELALRYPESTATALRTVREHVHTELYRHVDTRVQSIDVTVSALVPAELPRRVE